MPKIRYKDISFKAATLERIHQANQILTEYEKKGFNLTLRQLYYQFVSRGLIPNVPREYNNLGNIVNDARLAGLIDWNHIEDRTRGLESLGTWSDPASIVSACADQFRLDLWADQENRIEVWIEKDALTGIIEPICNELRVPFLSCRGYTSQSEMWRAAMRLVKHNRNGQQPVILHLGDHDPSGLDMSRDIQDRLYMFGADIKFERLALNMDQVEQYEPPPNPAKTTDARFEAYRDEHGDESWELDALEPEVLTELIRGAVLQRRDEEKWKVKVDAEDDDKRELADVSGDWDGCVTHVGGGCYTD